MEFIDKINQLKERVGALKDNLLTEEATKNALVMPFLNVLGYDVFNPLEVVPEYIADSRLKKDEKVDYALIKDNKPIILIECKKVENDKLDVKNMQDNCLNILPQANPNLLYLITELFINFSQISMNRMYLIKSRFLHLICLNLRKISLKHCQNFVKKILT